MKIKAFIPLIAGLCIGGFALKIGLSMLQKAKGAQGATAQVWAANADIPRGTRIVAGMLKPIEFPKQLAPPGSFTEQKELVGRVPRIDAPRGLPVLADMLSPPGTPTGVRVPPGLRAVAVKIDEGSGVDFHLEPGSHVDVVGYFQVQEGGKRETIARTLIENVAVAAVGDRLSTVTEEGESKGSRPTRAVTLLVTPDKVPILHLAEQRGKVKLSMRNRDDAEEIGPTEPVSDGELIDPFAAAAEAAPADQDTADDVKPAAQQDSLFGWLFNKKPTEEQPAEPPALVAVAPAPPAEPPWTVQVYRGNQLEVVRFRNRDSRERAEDQAAVSQSAPTPRPAVVTSASQPEPPVQNEFEEEQVAGRSADDQPEDQEPQEPTE